LRTTGLRFAVVTLLPVLALGWFLNSTVRHTLEARTADVYSGMTSSMFRLASDYVVHEEDFERGVALPDGQADLIDGLIDKVASGSSGVRVQIIGLDRTVLYAYPRNGVGARAPATPPLLHAFAGERATRFVRGQPDILEISMPVRFGEDRRVHGAIVASGIDSSVVATIDRDVRRMQTSLVIGLAALWLVLLPIASSLSRSLRRHAAANEHLALHDTLTDLPNRNLLHERVSKAVEDATVTGASVGLLLIDLDRFKDVNDTLGHRTGDQLLEHIAIRLSASVRPGDTVARLGGDEFAVLVGGINGPSDLADVAGRLTKAVTVPILLEGIEVAVEASIGGAVFPHAASDAVQLLQYADIAMYAAKAAHEPYTEYRAELDSHSPNRLALAADLGRAIDCDGQLVLHYQPVASPAPGEVLGMEALLRWHHPRLGLLSPLDFIPMAEQSGLMQRLSVKVLDQALGQARRWADQGIDLSIAVNLSASDLRSLSIVAEVEDALRRHGVPADRLELEVTETALLSSPDTAVTLVGALRDLGVRIALDDFGTGHSSLTYLQRLRPDRLKIDRSFVGAMTHATTEAEIVRSLIDLAHSLKIGVTAEGVESGDHWALLGALGCDLVQGYHLSRPLPVEVATPWLEARLAGASATKTAAAESSASAGRSPRVAAAQPTTVGPTTNPR
jgi:diguanylate cyclase (GGDEF)-like protein